MTRLVIDRLEESVAVVVAGDLAFELPRALLPPNVREGDTLRAHFEIDEEATQEARDAVRERLARLTASDDGEDFSL